jgi:Kef-type K+ transport system membrane component KefB
LNNSTLFNRKKIISIGIHAFFGAFVSGLCLPRKGELTDFLALRIELIVVEFFLP